MSAQVTGQETKVKETKVKSKAEDITKVMCDTKTVAKLKCGEVGEKENREKKRESGHTQRLWGLGLCCSGVWFGKASTIPQCASFSSTFLLLASSARIYLTTRYLCSLRCVYLCVCVGKRESMCACVHIHSTLYACVPVVKA